MLFRQISILSILFFSGLSALCNAQDDRNLDWLTDKERQFLKDHPVIRVAPTPHFPPFEYWDPGENYKSTEDDVFSGVVSSYLKHFEKELGVRFQLVRTDSWSENLNKLQLREIDAVPLLVAWDDRDYVAVSKPYITYPAVIVVRKDNDLDENITLFDLADKTVAVPDEYTGESFLRRNHPKIDVAEVIDPSHGVRMVATGEADAFFGGQAAVSYVAERVGITNVRVAGVSDFQYTNGFGVRSDWKIFADIISKTLDRTPDGQKSAFHSQWITEGFLQKKFYETRRFWWILGITASLLLIGSIGMAVLNRKQAAFIDQLEKEKQRTEAARREAEAANEAKSSFVAMISHEIRTPMNGILGMCELLRGTGLNSKQQDYLQCADSSANNLVELVNDILDFSKMEAGKLELDPQPFSLEKLIREITTLMRPQAERKGLALNVSTADTLSDAYIGDDLRLRQILLNLLSNAIKFTSEGEVSVRIKLRDAIHDSHHVAFEVADSGIGIASDKIERAFEPFEQEELSTTRRYGGTGLGLSICRKLAELMGGTASATSELGKGSTFQFSAKLKPTTLSPVERATAINAPEVQTRRVLLAEDNPVNQKVVTELLGRRGHQVDIVTTGEEALAAIFTGQFDLVLMDIEMPGMDGLTAIGELRKLEQHNDRHQVVVAMTGHAMLGDREKFLGAGMDGHLVKPFTALDLYQVVEDQQVNGSEPIEHSKGCVNSAVLDREQALAATGGNEPLADELLQTCLEESPKIVEQARNAINEGDFATAKRCGHSLRSSFGAVGARKAAQASEQLENLEMAGEEPFHNAVDEIVKAFDELANLAS